MRYLPALAGAMLVALAGGAHAQTPTIPPSGTLVDSSNDASIPTTVGASSVVVLPAVANGGRRAMLFIELNTSGATLACNENGVAVIGAAPSTTITGQYASINYASMGAIPNTAIQCIADSSGRSITIKVFPQ